MTTVAATLFNNLFLLFGTLGLGCVSIASVLVGRRAGWWWSARMWSRGLFATALSKLEVEPGERRPDQAVVYMANHQSLMDIPALLLTLPEETCFLAKKSLFAIPVLGQALRLVGFVPVDRQHRKHAKDAFDAGLKVLREGSSLLLFPEETRSDGIRLLPFKRGGFLLARRAGVPIVPIGISGTARVRGKNRWIVRSARVCVRYGRMLSAERVGAEKQRSLIEATRDEIARLADLTGSSTPEALASRNHVHSATDERTTRSSSLG